MHTTYLYMKWWGIWLTAFKLRCATRLINLHTIRHNSPTFLYTLLPDEVNC